MTPLSLAVADNSSEANNESSNAVVANQVQRDLIDFTEENNLNVTEAGDTLADQYFRRCKRNFQKSDSFKP